MNKYKQMLIDFMEEKLKQLRTCDIYKKLENQEITYFNEQDKKAILEWSEKDALHIWNALEYWILKEKSDGLGASVCPFCIKYLGNCQYCGYAQSHGICHLDTSNYKKIVRAIGLKKIFNLFSNEWYKQIIEKIKNKYI
ncbi:MAG TPA: hypothetical protein ENG63_03085 [Candidatus Desulfofervidus auxilii]|uniref:Uncharacterized protein n=1 Tax=Desulfofervidus auxilii TaxID=1621989 RepID=A0A7C0Y8R1_DESA2|nr:hypothetical protein [Candidatus Desulfofervidus auxilii]